MLWCFAVQISLGNFNRIERDIAWLNVIEPASPEPIEVFAAGVAHGAEKVGWCWVLKLPAFSLFFESIIKQLTSHNGLTQNVQCSCRLGISVRTKANNVFRIAHNWFQIVFRQLHVIYNGIGRAFLTWILVIPKLFGQILQE